MARIPSTLLPLLRDAKEFGDDIGFVVHRDGQRLKDIKVSFARTCKMAKLSDVTPHTLRHTRATWGMQAGVSVWKLAGFLGITPDTLEKVYDHHHPDFQKAAVENY